ncbi:HD-GYP domain-containing protein [Gracilibacillus sp. S3-1-1]|uniref:HD-GYP domain-containing protein n=1 Tax=Gracilibacillus pellucidus TaxID=3095368 RepID=A0ACC6M1E2_9BACI|nr:HD-GYP domain-containing protein [Gracilibacillus sp. S3-1-1]MDX8044733.1 HD-GYP domain-containing protein [Gracilibacillus sp. S3-1-1]
MRVVPVKNIRPGVELAKPVYDEHGRVLVQTNMQLTEVMIKRLKNMNITYAVIREENTDDILIHSPIPDEQRIEAIQQIKHTFQNVKSDYLMNSNHLLEKAAVKLEVLVKELTTELSKNEEVIHYLSDLLIVDDYLFAHSLNVSMYTLALAQELHVNSSDLEQLGLGAVLHDIGKTMIPDEIINKPGKLEKDEWKIVQAHTEYGFEILRHAHNIPLLVAHCAYQHHERMDGSGYPRGIQQNEIHPFAKIIGVADVFDAVTSNRVYRDAMLPHEGLDILYSGAGTQFDKHLVETFKKTVALYPNGLTVKLSDGRVGVVARQNRQLFDRPVVRILQENDRNVNPYDLDMKDVLDVTIVSTDNLHKQD